MSSTTGGEVDLDLGAYEWSLNVMLSRDNNIAAEKYTKRSSKKRRVIFKRGRNIGVTVAQSVPHVTGAIQD